MKRKMMNLLSHRSNMKRLGQTRSIFKMDLYKKPFSCIFVIDCQPNILYITALGANPFVIEVEVDNSCQVECSLKNDDYNKLLKYLNLKYDPKNHFKPINFFTILDKNTPYLFEKAPKYSDCLVLASKNHKIKEADQIYFIGWRNNSANESVSPDNNLKTRLAFGDHMADISIKNNISSRWSPYPEDEDLSKLQDFSNTI